MMLDKYRSDILAVIVAIVSVIVAYDVVRRERTEPRLRVTAVTQYRPDDARAENTWFPFGPSVFLIGDTAITNPLVSAFLIDNPGSAPIRPEDFVEPLTVKPTPDGAIILFGQFGPTNRNVHAKWEPQTDSVWSLAPTVINPGDSFGITMMSTREDYSSATYEWNARVVGVKSIEYGTLEDVVSEVTGGKVFGVFMNERMVIIFVAFYALCMTIALRVWRSTLLRHPKRFAHTAGLVAISLLAILTAEFVTYLVTMKSWDQFIGSYIGAVLFIICLALGLFKSVPRMPRSLPVTRAEAPEGEA